MVAILVADLPELPRGVQSQHWYRCAEHSAGERSWSRSAGRRDRGVAEPPRQDAGVV